MTLGNLGWLYLQHQDLEKACDYLREGIGHLEQALSLNPIHPVYSRSLLDQYVNLADASLKLGDYVTAADVASKLKTAAGVTSADKYAAACFLIRSGAAESADERLKADEREQHAKRHFQEARALVDNLLQDDFHDLVPLDEQAQEGIRMGLELDAKLKKAYEELLAKAQH
jgi:tetratricopeptide (TPR) repeat protein